MSEPLTPEEEAADAVNALADWQRFTRDPEDTRAPDRCAFPSHGHGSTMGICLRRRGHPADWHEGRSRGGSLVSWPAKAGDRGGR